jgi:hypothetical protein
VFLIKLDSSRLHGLGSVSLGLIVFAGLINDLISPDLL